MKKQSALVPGLESDERGWFRKPLRGRDKFGREWRVVLWWREREQYNRGSVLLGVERDEALYNVEWLSYDAMGDPQWVEKNAERDPVAVALAFQNIPESWTPGQD